MSCCCHVKSSISVTELFPKQPNKCLHLKAVVISVVLSYADILINGHPAACYKTQAFCVLTTTHDRFPAKVSSHPFYLHELVSCPAPQLVEQANKQTLTDEKWPANASV